MKINFKNKQLMRQRSLGKKIATWDIFIKLRFLLSSLAIDDQKSYGEIYTQNNYDTNVIVRFSPQWELNT